MRIWKCEFCQKWCFQNVYFRIDWGFLPQCVLVKKDLDVNDVCSKVNAAFLKAVLPFLSRVENEAINGIEEST